VTFGSVARFDEAGRLSRDEFFAPDDTAGLLARYEELRGELDPVRLAPGVDPGAATVVLARRHSERFNARDWEGYVELFSPDFALVDHRALGWESMDREAAVASARSAAEGAPDMRATTRVLAADDRLLARVLAYRGHTLDGGGLLEVGIGSVVVCDEHGRELREELFEPDDPDALTARLEALRAERDLVRLAPGVDPDAPGVKLTRTYCELFNRRDWDAFRDFFAPAYEGVDRRAVGCWGRVDFEGVLTMPTATVGMAPDATARADVLAVDDRLVARVLVHRGHALDGGGVAESTVGTVAQFDADGRLLREEWFEPDDAAEMLARFEELRAAREAPSPPA
jgi:hypothetical protein